MTKSIVLREFEARAGFTKIRCHLASFNCLFLGSESHGHSMAQLVILSNVFFSGSIDIRYSVVMVQARMCFNSLIPKNYQQIRFTFSINGVYQQIIPSHYKKGNVLQRAKNIYFYSLKLNCNSTKFNCDTRVANTRSTWIKESKLFYKQFGSV